MRTFTDESKYERSLLCWDQSTFKIGVVDTVNNSSALVSFNACNQRVAYIDKDGVFHVHVEPTDENAKKFIELVNKHLLKGHGNLAGIKADFKINKKKVEYQIVGEHS